MTTGKTIALTRWTFVDKVMSLYFNTFLDSVGEGKGGMTSENSTETCILPYVKQITSPSSILETGHSKSVHWDNPEGWDRKGGGRGFQDRGHIYTRG